MTKDKPAIFAACAIIAGIFFARMLSIDWTFWGAAALLCLIPSVIILFQNRSLPGRSLFPNPWFLTLLCISAGASYSINTQVLSTNDAARYVGISDSVTIVSRVIDEPKIRRNRLTALVDIISLCNDNDTMSVEGKVYLSIFLGNRPPKHPAGIMYGSILTCKSILQEPSDSRNPGEFSYKDYLALHDIHAMISVDDLSKIHISKERETNFLYEKIIFPVRDFIVRSIMSTLKGDNAYFLIGLILGDRSDISKEIKNAFMNTGTIHVLAVSGAHVAIVMAVVFTLFGLLRFPRHAKIIATIVVLFFYALLTGGAPSVVRASLMASLILAGKLFQERVNVYNTLGVAAVILLIIDPKQLFIVGFQLSFCAVFSIVYFYPKLELLIGSIPERLEEFKMIKWVWQAFAVSLAAQIGTIPFTAYYFGRISLISFAANLIVVPLVGLLVTTGISGIVLGLVSSFVGSCFLEVNNVIGWFTLTFVKLAEQVPLAVVNTATFDVRDAFFYFVAVAVIFNLKNKEILKRTIFVGLAGANIFLYASILQEEKDVLAVSFLDVGQGDAAFIQFPDGETMLIDAGPFGAGKKSVAPFLRRNGISHIDAIVATHPHADHIGGMPFIMQHFDIGEVIDQEQRAESRLYSEYDSLKDMTHSQLSLAGMQPFHDSTIRLYCLHPTNQYIDTDARDGYTDLNESSIVLKLVYGSTSFLFTGDAEMPAEENMVRCYGDFLDSDVLKVGHHGSITSSTMDFLNCVTPEDAVISVGKFNTFRHPSMIVVNRLKQMKAKVFRTDEDGAVVFVSDGHTIKRFNWKDE